MSFASTRRGIVVAAIWSLCCGSGQVGWAGSGTKIALPVGPTRTVNGLSMVLSSEWVEGRGYRPFTIDVTCAAPAAGDRTLEIELGAAMWPSRKYITVGVELEIPAGSMRASKVVSVPQFATMQFLSLDVWEDGVHLDDLSFEDRSISTAGIGAWGQGEMPSVLFVTSKPLDLSGLSFLSPNTMYVPAGSAVPFSSAAQVTTFAERPLADLVENWINYSSLDVIFLSLADVETLAATRPKVWLALCQWTWAGGNLCVYGVIDDWRGLKALDERLKCPASAEQAAQPTRGWNEPSPALYNKKLQLGSGADMPGGDETDSGDTAQAANDKTAKLAEAVKASSFVWKEAMLGRVVAIAGTAPFPGEPAEWQWVFNTITPARWKWRFRHGVSFDNDNLGFDNFLIGDIGLPPIRTYRVLITLFVIAIGPLNYWLLRRHGRLHLLLFTVPAAALLAALGLIGYAFVADGLESRLRARSFTFLDQVHHEAVSWARLSYYAGFAPASGLLFPDDTVVLPLEKAPEWGSFSSRRRHMLWTPEQRLTRGWLPSRTPMQYVTLRAYASAGELVVVPSEDKLRYSVKNRLGTKIKQLVLCDESGKLHFGNEVDQTGQASLRSPATDADAKAETAAFLRELNHDAPRLPPRMEHDPAASTGGLFPSIRRAQMAWRNQGDYQETSNSLLEVELQRVALALDTKTVKPRSYVAIVERPGEVIVGIDGLIESQSLHVICGAW